MSKTVYISNTGEVDVELRVGGVERESLVAAAARCPSAPPLAAEVEDLEAAVRGGRGTVVALGGLGSEVAHLQLTKVLQEVPVTNVEQVPLTFIWKLPNWARINCGNIWKQR